MQIDGLTRNNNHVHYVVLDDTGLEVKQVDRDLSVREIRLIGVGKRSIERVVAETEGADLVARQPREKAASSVVVHAFEPHEHPYLSSVPDHTHDEIKATEDYLVKRVKDAETFITEVQEKFRGHGHVFEAHGHPDKPLQVHDHAHVHDDYSGAIAKLHGLIDGLALDLRTVAGEHSHTQIQTRLMAVESEARTMQGLMLSHTHDHSHADLDGRIIDEVAHRKADINSLESRIESHGHGAYASKEHDHEHDHAELKEGLRKVETKALEVMMQGAKLVEQVSQVDASHVHQDDRDAVTKLTQALGTLEREQARHGHPHEHTDVVERFAKLDEKLAGHSHAFEPHEHSPHAHEQIAHLDALITGIEGKLVGLGNRIDKLEREGFLKEIPAHTHEGYLVTIPEHEHPEYDEKLQGHIAQARTRINLQVLSEQEVTGKKRLITEVVD